MPPPLSAFHSLRRLLEDLRRHTRCRGPRQVSSHDPTADDGDPQSLTVGRSLVSPYSWPSYCLASRKWSRAAATITIQGVAGVRRSHISESSFRLGKRERQAATLPACAQLRQPVLRICAFAGCGMRMSAPVTRLTSVIESYGKLIAACALRMDSSSGPDMKQHAFPSFRFTCAA